MADEMQSWGEWIRERFGDRRAFASRTGYLTKLSIIRDALIYCNNHLTVHIPSVGLDPDPLPVVNQIQPFEHDRRCGYDKCLGKQDPTDLESRREPADIEVRVFVGEPRKLKDGGRFVYSNPYTLYLHHVCAEDLVADREGRFPFPRDRENMFPLGFFE
jgi:hypothetical protein